MSGDQQNFNKSLSWVESKWYLKKCCRNSYSYITFLYRTKNCIHILLRQHSKTRNLQQIDNLVWMWQSYSTELSKMRGELRIGSLSTEKALQDRFCEYEAKPQVTMKLMKQDYIAYFLVHSLASWLYLSLNKIKRINKDGLAIRIISN